MCALDASYVTVSADRSSSIAAAANHLRLQFCLETCAWTRAPGGVGGGMGRGMECGDTLPRFPPLHARRMSYTVA